MRGYIFSCTCILSLLEPRGWLVVWLLRGQLEGAQASLRAPLRPLLACTVCLAAPCGALELPLPSRLPCRRHPACLPPQTCTRSRESGATAPSQWCLATRLWAL